MCKEHPFHSLYQVYCLLPERNISDFSRRQSGRLVAQTMPSTQTERGSAAQVVFDKLRADTAVQDKVAEVEKLCNASWQWAKFPVGKGTKYARLNYLYQIPPELLICRLPALRVPVPTFPLPLDPTMRYDNCISIDSFEKQFQLVGGVNLPKICSCKASNGKTYKQLVRHAALSTRFLLTIRSSRAATMTCGRMQLWSKFSTSSMACCNVTGRPSVVSSASGDTKSYPWTVKPVFWNSLPTPRRCAAG